VLSTLPVLIMLPILPLRHLLGLRDKQERRIASAESVTWAARDSVKGRIGIVCAIVSRAVASVRRVVFTNPAIEPSWFVAMALTHTRVPAESCQEFESSA